MAYTISVCDTHRIPYPNATVKAYKLGSAMQTTDQIKFKHGKNGPELGFEVKTNSRGYFCDNNGDLYTNGVFVTEDAIIKVTLPDGTSTTWESVSDNDTPVNDGKLLGTRTRDSADDDLNEKWSANSENNYILDYNDLTNKPKINEWMEVEQIVTMENASDTVDVDKYCKTMTIASDDNVHPYGWELQNGEWVNTNPYAPNSNWSIKLNAAQDRVAQVICVRNWTPWRLALLDSQGNTIRVLDAYDGKSNGEFVSLYGTSESSKPFHKDVDVEGLKERYATVLKSGVVENKATSPIIINDLTPNMMQVVIDPSYPFYLTQLYIKSAVTKPRTVKLWLQNVKGNSGLPIIDAGNSNNLVGIVASFTIVELILKPGEAIKMSDWLRTQGSTLLIDGTNQQTLPPEATFIVGSVSEDYFVNALSSDTTEKMIYGFVTNSTSVPLTFTLDIAGTAHTIPLLPNTLNKFVVHKQGTQSYMLSAPANVNSGKYLNIAATSNDGHYYYYKVTRTVSTQDTVCINIPYLMQLQTLAWGYFGGNAHNEHIILDISDLIQMGQSTVLRFKVDSYVKSSSSSIKSVFIGFGDSDSKTTEVIPLDESVANDTLCVNRKNIVATIHLNTLGYSVTYGVEDTLE